MIVLFLLSFGLLSLWLGPDANWDLKNYHAYNAYAAVNSRLNFDVAPAQIQSYFNPILDVLYIGTFQTLPVPIAVFLSGCLAGLGALFLFRISCILLNGAGSGDLFGVILAVVIGSSGSSFVSQIGSSSHEVILATVTLYCVYLVVRELQEDGPAPGKVVWVKVGALLGAATALKWTSAIYAVSIVISSAAVMGLKNKNLYRLTIMVMAMSVAFLIVSLPWFVKMQSLFQSPVFPFFNKIFLSPWADPVNFSDQRFLPRDWTQYLFYPLYWFSTNNLVTELVMRDQRVGIALLVSVVYVFQSAITSLSGRFAMSKREAMTRSQKFVVEFFWVSYTIWLLSFSIYRYAVPVEMLSGVVIVMLVMHCIRRASLISGLLAVVTFVILATTVYPDWGRSQQYSELIKVDFPELPAGSVVLLLGADPMSYVIPFANADVRFISPSNNFTHPDKSNLIQQKANHLVMKHSGPMYSLELDQSIELNQRILDRYDLTRIQDKCRKIQDTFNSDLILCPLKRAQH